MKRIISTFFVMLLLPIAAYSYDAYIGCIYYNFSGSVATVTYKSTSYNSYSGSVVIPASVTYNNKTYSVTSIGNNAFYNCNGLTSIIIPESVTSIGSRAFCGCDKLTFVHISDLAAWCNISFHDELSQPLAYSHYLYLNGEKVTDLVIPDGVTSIPNYAFYNCSSLTSVTIPSCVTSIGQQVFYGCSGLTSVTVGSGVLSIGNNAFQNTFPKKVIWLTNTPPNGYVNLNGSVNYVANNLYTSLTNVTEYPYLSSLFEVEGVKYVPVSPSERTCDAIDCAYNESAEHIDIGETVTNKGITLSTGLLITSFYRQIRKCRNKNLIQFFVINIFDVSVRGCIIRTVIRQVIVHTLSDDVIDKIIIILNVHRYHLRTIIFYSVNFL